jgi:hypothetical protein
MLILPACKPGEDTDRVVSDGFGNPVPTAESEGVQLRDIALRSGFSSIPGSDSAPERDGGLSVLGPILDPNTVEVGVTFYLYYGVSNASAQYDPAKPESLVLNVSEIISGPLRKMFTPRLENLELRDLSGHSAYSNSSKFVYGSYRCTEAGLATHTFAFSAVSAAHNETYRLTVDTVVHCVAETTPTEEVPRQTDPTEATDGDPVVELFDFNGIKMPAAQFLELTQDGIPCWVPDRVTHLYGLDDDVLAYFNAEGIPESDRCFAKVSEAPLVAQTVPEEWFRVFCDLATAHLAALVNPLDRALYSGLFSKCFGYTGNLIKVGGSETGNGTASPTVTPTRDTAAEAISVFDYSGTLFPVALFDQVSYQGFTCWFAKTGTGAFGIDKASREAVVAPAQTDGCFASAAGAAGRNYEAFESNLTAADIKEFCDGAYAAVNAGEVPDYLTFDSAPLVEFCKPYTNSPAPPDITPGDVFPVLP